MKIAVCPGSFDPITVGHLDLVERSARIFDKVIVCVVLNGEKRPMFTPQERLELVRGAIAHIPNAEAACWEGLLAQFARQEGAQALVKGVRNCIDFDWEYQMAQINRDLCPDLETVILPAQTRHLHISSTMVRDFIRHDQALDGCVPAGAIPLLQKIREGRR